MSEAGKRGIEIAKIGLGVSIAMLIVLLISSAWLYTQTTILQTEVNNLESKYNDYVATHGHSNSEYQMLSINHTQLEESYQALTQSCNQLLLEFNNLTGEHQALTENYSQLQLSYQQFNTTYQDLKDEYEQLETTHQTLNAAYNSYREAYRALVSTINLHVDHPSQDEKSLITPEDPAVENKVQEITGGWSNTSDWTEYWTEVKMMYDWVVNNIEYRHDGLYPHLPADPNYQVRQFGEMWQFPNQTLDLERGDCDDMATLLCSMIHSYDNNENDVECIAITQHMAVYIPVAEDEVCILDPSGRYYTNTGFPFYEITSKDILNEVNDWLDYWRTHGIEYPVVDWIFSINIWKGFWNTDSFISWLYGRYQD
ncbi:MAG: hypothetical protein JSV57_01725 [Candidatus Bathyarchaeota archaeon]|nr:MAG: hypothetical protein JSV57_01725 [Candidatus Bathyarchaeota archaeon]